MKIRGWHIDGFGVFREHRVEQLPDGLTVFWGPNEAGKSTLLAFLRGVLFGYPSGRSREPRYPPLQGGRHGGKVLIETDDQGVITVCRYAERRTPLAITLPDGSLGTETDLTSILGGADKGLFQQIFAFSLSELQLATLESEGVRSRIFSAGIAGAGRSASDVIRSLDAEIQAIHVARGRTTRVAELLRALDDLRARLREAHNKVAEYSDLCRLEDEGDKQVQELTQTRDEFRSQMQRYQLLEELWATWSDLQSAREKLELLAPIDNFPANPERRLSETKGNCRNAQKDLDNLRAGRQGKTDQCTRIAQGLDDGLAKVSEAVRIHLDDLRLHREHLTSRPAVQQEVAQAQSATDEALQDLGPRWTRSHVEAFDTSLPREEEVRQWKERLTTAGGQISDTSRSLDSAEKELATAREERDRIKAQLDPANAPYEDALVKSESALARLLELKQEEAILAARADTQAVLVEGQKKVIEELRNSQASTYYSPIPLLVGLGAAVLAIAALWRLVAGDVPGCVALGLMAILAGGTTWLLSRKRPKASTPTWPAENLHKAEENHRNTCETLSKTRAALKDTARTLEMADVPTPEQVAGVERKLREDRSALDQWQATGARLKDAEDKLNEQVKQRDVLRVAMVKTEKTLSEVENAWQQWKERLGIPESSPPDGVLAFLPRVKSARDKVRMLDATRERLERLNRQIAAWQERARELLGQAGKAAPPTDSEGPVIDAFRELAQACRDDAARRGEVQRLQDEIAATDATIQTAERQSEQANQQLRTLLAEAAVADEAAFEAKYEIFRQRQQLLRDIETWEQAITNRIGRGPEAEEISAELSTGRMDQWRQSRSQAERDLQQAEQEYEEAVRRHQDATRTRKSVEDSANVPTLELEIESRRCELARALNEWKVKSIAKAIIKTTLQRFVRDRQPGVLAEAGRTFRQVTANRYERIEQDSDQEGVVIIDHAHERKLPEHLSRGTAEQLYLCLRLALAREFGQQRCSLPVVMDDVLVNFDPARAGAMAQVLTEFAGSNQVLLFTCHPGTVEILRGASPEVKVENMEVV